MFSLGGVLAILLSVSGALSPADAARTLEAQSLSGPASQLKCRRLASFEVRSIQHDNERVTIEALESIVISPAGAPDRVETARIRLTLLRARRAWTLEKRESLDEQLAATDPKDVPPEAWTSQLSIALARRAIRLVNEAKLNDAERLAQLAERMAAQLGDPAALSFALGVRSIGARMQGQHELAVTFGTEAVDLATAVNDPDILAPALLRLGRALDELKATDHTLYARAFQLAEGLEDKSLAALTASQLARYYDNRREHRLAFEFTTLALRYAEQSGDPAPRTSALLNLAGAYYAQGDFELAAEYWRRAAAVAREHGFVNVASSALAGAGGAESHRGNHDAAESLLSEAIALINTLPDRTLGVLAGLHFARAEILLRANRLEEAERDLAAILRLQGENNHFLGLTAWLHLERGQPEVALQYLYRMVRPPHGLLSREDRVFEARAWYDLGKLDRAVTILREIICDYERERSGVTADPRQRWMWMERTMEPYRHLLHILVKIGDADGALELAESVKARSLAESLADRDQKRIGRAGEEHEIDAKIRRLNRALHSQNGGKEQLRRELAAARIELTDARARLSTDDGQYGAPSTLAVSHRESETFLILEYQHSQDELVLFAVRRGPDGDRLLAVHRIDKDAVQRAVDRAVQAVRQRNLRYDEYARPLYDLLIGPVEPFVREAAMIGIIPDGELWRVPFHALRSADGKYLIERAPIFFAPSLAMLNQAPPRRKSAPKTVMAFANPATPAPQNLQDTEAEVLEIGALYGRAASRILIGANAREAVLKNEGDQYDVLHFATHGVADEAQPLFSYLLLSPEDQADDGLLEAREIASLDLDAEVAVLSACSTGRGRVHAGEGVIGLSWAFLAAGCPRTVVSQWDAVSAATSTLMREFHRHLRAGAPAPHALRTAALAVRSMPQYRHPFYWAPFVVVGAP
jgi:CHAT domain-containing protein